MDLVVKVDSQGLRVQESDTNGDGRADTWTSADAKGNVAKRREDRDHNGEVDFTVYFKQAVAYRIDEDTTGKGCTDLRRWLDAEGNVTAEEKDSSGNCKYDTWNYYHQGQLVRQGQATSGKGPADVLSHFGKSGELTIQELITVQGGLEPDKKLFLAADGTIFKHCADTNGDGRLETILTFAGDVLQRAVIDTDGDGTADEREIYANGERVRLDTDTNGDHRPDVVQHLQADEITRQDEDTDFDGVIDLRFDGETPVSVEGKPEAPAALPKLGCGRFHSFWRRR
jgi:hypothetical protein